MSLSGPVIAGLDFKLGGTASQALQTFLLLKATESSRGVKQNTTALGSKRLSVYQ